MIPKSSADWRRALVSGALAGAVAGLALTLMMTVMSLVSGHDIWFGMKGAAAPFLGDRAMTPGFDLSAVWLGVMTHFAISIAWAIPFAVLGYGFSRGETLAASVAWGLVVWIGMYGAILPAVGLGEMVRQAPVLRSAIYHMLFGLMIGGGIVSFRQEEARQGGFFHEHAHA